MPTKIGEAIATIDNMKVTDITNEADTVKAADTTKSTDATKKPAKALEDLPFERFCWDVKCTMVQTFPYFKDGAFKDMIGNYGLSLVKCLTTLAKSALLNERVKVAVKGLENGMFEIFCALKKGQEKSSGDMKKDITPALGQWSKAVGYLEA